MLNRFAVYLEMAVFPQHKMAPPVAEGLQRDLKLHFHLCLSAISSAKKPCALSVISRTIFDNRIPVKELIYRHNQRYFDSFTKTFSLSTNCQGISQIVYI